jgi:hypothetical protein
MHPSRDFIQADGTFPPRKDEQNRGSSPFLHLKTALLGKLLFSIISGINKLY